METGGAARTYGRSAALLTVALGATGALVYLFFATASHVLSREDYGRIVVLWSAMFLGVSILFRPVELLLARSLAHAKASGANTGPTVSVGARIQVGLSAAFVFVMIAFKGEVEDGLFDGDALLFWSLVASVAGFAAAYWLRGYLAGSGRFGLYTFLLLSDGVCRGLFAVAVAITASDGTGLAALGIAIPPGMSAAATFVALRVTRSAPEVPPEKVEESPAFTLVEGGGFAASVLLVMVSEQVFLNSGPLIALARDGTASAGFVFNVLMLVRAPVLLFQATATSLLPHLTAMGATGSEAGEREFHVAVRHTVTGITAFAAIAILAVIVAGPALMRLAFGDEFHYDRTGLLIVAAGMGLYLIATTQNQVALARGRAMAAAGCWTLAAVLMVGWLFVADLEVARLVETGFTGATALLCGLLTWIARARDPSLYHPPA